MNIQWYIPPTYVASMSAELFSYAGQFPPEMYITIMVTYSRGAHRSLHKRTLLYDCTCDIVIVVFGGITFIAEHSGCNFVVKCDPHCTTDFFGF